MMQLNADVPFVNSLPGLVVRWSHLRAHADSLGFPVPLIAEGLSLRARRVLDQISAVTVQELLAMDPEELIERENVGRTTLAALVVRAQESLPPVTTEVSTPDFIQLVDTILDALAERARRIVVARFDQHTRSIDVAREEGVTRERVRQIEEKFVGRVRAAVRRHNLPLEDVLGDGVIELDELTAGQYEGGQTSDFYVSLARTVLTGGDSYVDVERFYSAQLQLLGAEIRNDDEFILGRFSIQRAMEMSRTLTPALAEVGPEELWRRIRTELRGEEIAGRLVGRKPQVGRIIRALLRSAAGPVSVSLLVGQLRMVLGTYGEVSYFDDIRLRNKLIAMEGVHMSDEQTASLSVPDEAIARKWSDRAVAEIRSAGKPYSLVRFFDKYDDAPFDAFGIASLLRADDRVIHVGRRLYAPAEYEAEGSLRIAALITEALKKSDAPMTRGELVAYVHERRDLICTQIDNYFSRVPDLVLYTPDIVGFSPLSREVMLQMLGRENCVVSLLRARSGEGPADIGSLWLIPDDEPDISRDEEKAIVKASRRWKKAAVDTRSSGLFFGLREDA